MFLSMYTENGSFVPKGLCLCPEELKPGLPVISALVLVYRAVLHWWGKAAGRCKGRVSSQGSLERKFFWGR